MYLLRLIYVCIPFLILQSCNNDKNQALPELKTESVTAISQTTAKSGGNITTDGGANITLKGVCWGINYSPTVLDFHTSDGQGNALYQSNLTDLAPDTEYHVRAFATNQAGTAYGNDKIFKTLSAISGNQIIADHTIVDKYDAIPAEYIAEIKKMWLVYAGESHSAAIRTGLNLLETANPTYAVSTVESGAPEAYTTSNLRASRATWGDLSNTTGWIYSYGEEDWFTSSTAISRTKAGITYCNTNNLAISIMGFGWCWDPAIIDMTAYLAATQAYIDYCTTNGYSTKVIFTTGPVDEDNATGELGYNKYLAYEAIRSYVESNSSRVLFDYADILCYNDDGSTNSATWSGHTYPIITTTNYSPVYSGHTSSVGCIRLAKAMWWMLARMAGWDGDSTGKGN